MRVSKARARLRAGHACHMRWIAYGNSNPAFAWPSHTRGGSRMRASRTYGSVRGARGNSRPYRETAERRPWDCSQNYYAENQIPQYLRQSAFREKRYSLRSLAARVGAKIREACASAHRLIFDFPSRCRWFAQFQLNLSQCHRPALLGVDQSLLGGCPIAILDSR